VAGGECGVPVDAGVVAGVDRLDVPAGVYGPQPVNNARTVIIPEMMTTR